MSDELNSVNLKHPILVKSKDGGEMEVSTLKLARFKARHLKALPKDFAQKGGILEPSEAVPLIAGLTGIPEEAAEEIDFDDLVTILEKIRGFFQKPRRTGKKSSGA